MTTAVAQTKLKPLEIRTLIVGFILVGIADAVTTVRYLLNMIFVYQWLVWIICIAFAGVALITLEWIRAYRSPAVEAPGGFSLTCNMVPLGVTLFSVATLKGVCTKASAAISGVLSGMIVFMAVGNPLFSFPWSGCA